MADELQPSTQGAAEPPDNFTSILIGAGVIFIISVVPFLNLLNAVCCLGIIGGGFAGAFHYINAYSLTLTGGNGFKLGALAGLLGGLAALVVSFLLQAVFDYQPGTEEVQQFMLRILGTTPEAKMELEQAFREQRAEGLTVSSMLISTLGTLILYPLFAGLGGAIASSAVQRGKENS
jgi:hypothetical protein